MDADLKCVVRGAIENYFTNTSSGFDDFIAGKDVVSFAFYIDRQAAHQTMTTGKYYESSGKIASLLTFRSY